MLTSELAEHHMPEVSCLPQTTGSDNDSKPLTSSILADALGEDVDNRKVNTLFECNICFEMAGEPVVTSCGHLFCWPCLYQWLYVHSDHRECPMCKGEVTKENITPVYGRGSLIATEKEHVQSESALKIPPRPCGNQLKRFRQQLGPLLTRQQESLAVSLRQMEDCHIPQGTRTAEQEPSIQELRNQIRNRAQALMRERMLQRGFTRYMQSDIDESVPGDASSHPTSITSSIVGGEAEFSFESTRRSNGETVYSNGIVGQSENFSNQHGMSNFLSSPMNEEEEQLPCVANLLEGTPHNNTSTLSTLHHDASSSEYSAGPSDSGYMRSSTGNGGTGSPSSSDSTLGDHRPYKRQMTN